MVTPRSNVSVVVVRDKLYAVGGFSGKTFLNTIEYLDKDTNEWTTFVQQNISPVAENGKEEEAAASLPTLNECEETIPNGGHHIQMNGNAAESVMNGGGVVVGVATEDDRKEGVQLKNVGAVIYTNGCNKGREGSSAGEEPEPRVAAAEAIESS